jgi:multidrug efflux pump subunit AcrB
MITFLVTGTMSYINLGREEDPSFTLKTMVIQANWPGASAEEMTEQVTDRIEKKLEDLETLFWTKSMTTEGRTIILVELLSTTRGDQVGESWAQVRNMIGDIHLQFPAGIQGPFYNDRFGDVFGNIFAFTSDGLSQRQIRDIVEDTRSKLLTVDDIGKVEVFGAQQEVIYLEFSTSKLAALGLDKLSTWSFQPVN